MENKRVVIIGGSGIAGMQAAVTLSEMGIASVIVEKEERASAGKLNRWDRLLPTMTPAREVLEPMRERVSASGAEVLTSRSVLSIEDEGRGVVLDDRTRLDADAVIVASGFDLFPAEMKEEYGYGPYDNVYTTVDLERMFREGTGIRTRDGRRPSTVAFLHRAGSRRREGRPAPLFARVLHHGRQAGDRGEAGNTRRRSIQLLYGYAYVRPRLRGALPVRRNSSTTSISSGAAYRRRARRSTAACRSRPKTR